MIPTIDFGRAASDYALHRLGPPPELYDALHERGLLSAGVEAIDLGAGTGLLSLGLAARGLRVTAVEPSPDLRAWIARRGAALGVTTVGASAEATGLPSASADLVTASQCWHWFDRSAAADEVYRLMRPGGHVAIIHMDWLSDRHPTIADSARIVRAFNPSWPPAGVRLGTAGCYPRWFADLARFEQLQSFSFDVNLPYDTESWIGRMRASAGVLPTMDPAHHAAWEQLTRQMLRQRHGDAPFGLPHRLWVLIGRRPAG